jgi:hypothetical protein
VLFAAMHMSLPGTSRSWWNVALESAQRSKADIDQDGAHLAMFGCAAYIPDMSRDDSKRARHRQRQARYEARQRVGVGRSPPTRKKLVAG